MVISDKTVKKNRVLKVITLILQVNLYYTLSKVTDGIDHDVLLEESTNLAPLDEYLPEGYKEYK